MASCEVLTCLRIPNFGVLGELGICFLTNNILQEFFKGLFLLVGFGEYERILTRDIRRRIGVTVVS